MSWYSKTVAAFALVSAAAALQLLSCSLNPQPEPPLAPAAAGGSPMTDASNAKGGSGGGSVSTGGSGGMGTGGSSGSIIGADAHSDTGEFPPGPDAHCEGDNCKCVDDDCEAGCGFACGCADAEPCEADVACEAGEETGATDGPGPDCEAQDVTTAD